MRVPRSVSLAVLIVAASLVPGCDAESPECDPFADRVVSFSPGPGAGLGQERMPAVALGPPVGAGDVEGGSDVVSLGVGGEIVLEFEGEGIPDGPGPDLILFENAFLISGDPSNPYAELASVAVSDDGSTFVEFPCASAAFPYEGCSGWHPVYANPDNGIDPTNPEAAGGDAFDLADAGLRHARFVRIRDLALGLPAPPTAGYDLDAAAAVHACP